MISINRFKVVQDSIIMGVIELQWLPVVNFQLIPRRIGEKSILYCYPQESEISSFPYLALLYQFHIQIITQFIGHYQ